MSFRTWNAGGCVYVHRPRAARPPPTWGLIEREQLNFLLIVGRRRRPLLDELTRHDYDLVDAHRSGCRVARPVGQPQKRIPAAPADADDRRRPRPEAGGQLPQVAGGGATTGTFPISPGNHVLGEDLDRNLPPRRARLAGQERRLALGYLGDAAKTARTYPVIDGVRYAVPGRPGKPCAPT
ncbi:MAG: hypothetical protein R2713_18545 [Ilumatobacteraceae bacterium]